METTIIFPSFLNLLLLLLVAWVLSKEELFHESVQSSLNKVAAWILIWFILIETGYNCTILAVNMMKVFGAYYVEPEILHHPAFSAIFISKHFFLYFIRRIKK